MPTKPKIKVAMLITKWNYMRTIHPDDLAALSEFAEVVNPGPYPDTMDAAYMKKHLAQAEACFTCWGTPPLSADILEAAPNLRLILHGAGTPKAVVTDAVWERGIRVATCAPIIAIDVAETTLGMMIFCLKRMMDGDRIARDGRWHDGKTMDVYKDGVLRLNRYLNVGIVGASHVGRNLIRMLKPFDVNIRVYDPFVTPEDERSLGVTLCSLEELMAKSDVVTSHLPKLTATDGLISREMLALMQDGALFINTARGSVVDEQALIDELESGRIHAYLDVYDTEPLPMDSRLVALPNVLLSPHISGGHTDNGSRERGNYMVNQLYNFHFLGRLKDEAVKDMIETMA